MKLTWQERAFLAGFEASSEVWNGEIYGTNNESSDEEIWEDLKKYFEEYKANK